jgi:Bacterial archaeo-eukaryotic release factor family 2
MLRTHYLAPLYQGGGPYATAYLDTSRNVPDAPTQIALRWRTLRRQLGEQGADEATLAALERAAGEDHGVPGRHGQALVGATGQLRHQTELPGPPRSELARWAALPHLMPLVTQLAPMVPYVLAVVDRVGADISAHGPRLSEEVEVTGEDWPVHKAGAGGWAELRYQHKVENVWSANARQAAKRVESAVRRLHARRVIVAGDVRERAELISVLEDPARDLVVEVEHGGRHPGVDIEPLRAEVGRLVAEVAAGDDAALLERFDAEIGRRRAGVEIGEATEGRGATVQALQRAQVDTLLVVDDTSSDAEAWIGPDALHLALTEQELRDMGVDAPVRDRLDAAMVRAVASTAGSIVVLARDQHPISDGVGALLRYADPVAT